MTTEALSALTGASQEVIKKKRQRSKDNIITIGEDQYIFTQTKGIGRGGKIYTYAPLTLKKPRRSTTSSAITWERLEELDGFDLHASKHSVEEKLLLVRFIKQYNYTMKTIIKSLDPLATSKQIEALSRKFNRWKKSFEEGGKAALEDKRGKKKSLFKKIDEALLRKAIVGAGARGIRENYYGIWDLYCYLWQQAHSEGFDPDRSKVISYTAISRGIRKLLQSDALLHDYWTKGHDGLLQSYPVGIKDITYTNQEWQVDATRFDFMVKLVQEDGSVKIARHNLTAVIDVHTGNAVATLTQAIDSYAQVRVLYKAFGRMGLPEQIYMDNGMDYASTHYQSVLDDMGIIDISAEVGQGRQKGKIERFFGSLQTELAKLPGYIGNDVSKRTHIENQTASKIDIRTSKATRINPDRLLSFHEMEQIIESILAQRCADYQAQAGHLLESDQMEDIRRKLGKRATRPLHQDGIKFNSYTYISADLWINGLGKGDQVEVYEDIDDINRVYVYHEGLFVCEALNRDLGVAAMSLEEHKAAKRANHRNRVAPMRAEVREGARAYEAYQDAVVSDLLGYKPTYAAQPKAKKVTKTLDPAQDAMADIMKAAGY